MNGEDPYSRHHAVVERAGFVLLFRALVCAVGLTKEATEVGGGLAQVGVLLAAIVIGLPCFFFTLLALLDHFEQGLTNAPRAVTRPAQVVQLSTAPESEADSELIGAAVVELPSPFNPSSAPAAATG